MANTITQLSMSGDLTTLQCWGNNTVNSPALHFLDNNHHYGDDKNYNNDNDDNDYIYIYIYTVVIYTVKYSFGC